MHPDSLKRAEAYKKAAFEWLLLARETHDPIERPKLLAIANEWLAMAHETPEPDALDERDNEQIRH
jgi:hypothetical protein